MSRADVHGPIDFLLIEFQEDRLTGEAAQALLDLVDKGIVALYDVLFVGKSDDGLPFTVTDDGGAPQSTVMDETFKVAISRFDDRISVGGTAELASYDLSLLEKRRATISMVVRDVFPEGGDVAKAEFWTGLRPMTPSNVPYIGKSRYSNLFLNTGHGTLGWTMGCGSGRAIADIVSGRIPEVDFAFTGMEQGRRSALAGKQAVQA